MSRERSLAAILSAGLAPGLVQSSIGASGLAVLALVFFTMAARFGSAQTPSERPIVKLDPALDVLVSPDAKLLVAKSGLGVTEGPNWVREGKNGFLIFSDIPANAIYKLTPDGNMSVFLDQSGYHGPIDGYKMLTMGIETNNGRDPSDPLFQRRIQIGSDGLTLDPQGRVVICTFGGRSVERLEKNGKRTVLADRYEGKRLGGPNDVVVKNDGAIYFSDTFGGMRGRDKDPLKELDFQAIYRIKDGKVTLAIKDIPTPNGLAFSPDEKYLYANGSAANYIRRYEVNADDTLTDGRPLIDLNTDKSPEFTDGMRVDAKGNIYSSGPRGVWIISPEGKHLGTVLVPERVANVAFGDSDYKTLYITARTSVYKIRVNTPGHHR